VSRAYLGLGSNLGDREANLRTSLEELERRGGVEVVRESSIYETEPVGMTEQPPFLNAVVEVETELAPRELLHLALDVERRIGRTREVRWGPRKIDIDILTFDQVTLDEPGLIVPHPRLTQRRFVLEPLLEIAPDAVLPDGTVLRAVLDSIPEVPRVVRLDDGGSRP
jgi:2-amino-4-hydroxy-6-hydroxymethyldihydropteridine diphosphokinase